MYLTEEEILDFESIFDLNNTSGVTSDRDDKSSDNTSSTSVPVVNKTNVIIPEPVNIGNRELTVSFAFRDDCMIL